VQENRPVSTVGSGLDTLSNALGSIDAPDNPTFIDKLKIAPKLWWAITKGSLGIGTDKEKQEVVKQAINQASALFRQSNSEFIPDPLNNVWMAALTNVGVRDTGWSSNCRLQCLLSASQIPEDVLIHWTVDVYVHVAIQSCDNITSLGSFKRRWTGL
jgi:hypothetical protein